MASYVPTFIGLSIVFMVGATITWMFSKRKKWRAVGKLSKMYIYPLKSGKYREVMEAECSPIGLKHFVSYGKAPLRDRVFVVYNSMTMKFLCAKSDVRLLQINIEPKDFNSVTLSYPGKENIDVILRDEFDDKKIEMWENEKIRINDCGDAAAKWVSEVVTGSIYRLAYWPEDESWRRDISFLKHEFKVFKRMKNEYTGAYSDLSSYNFINVASVEDLNLRLKENEKVRVVNFRPNFVVEGPPAYEEDKWRYIKIGDVVFESFRPCTRCLATTINPDTGKKNEQVEPLRTLRKYRTMKMLGEDRVDASVPVLGLYAGLIESGKVKCGDTVYVSD